MYRLIMAFLMALIAATALCQTRQVRYFNNSYLQKETSEKNGKFSQTISQNPDGSVTTEVKDIKNDEVISTETYKGDEPVGKWKYKRRNIPEELDYSFDLIYSDKSCTDT